MHFTLIFTLFLPLLGQFFVSWALFWMKFHCKFLYNENKGFLSKCVYFLAMHIKQSNQRHINPKHSLNFMEEWMHVSLSRRKHTRVFPTSPLVLLNSSVHTLSLAAGYKKMRIKIIKLLERQTHKSKGCRERASGGLAHAGISEELFWHNNGNSVWSKIQKK